MIYQGTVFFLEFSYNEYQLNWLKDSVVRKKSVGH